MMNLLNKIVLNKKLQKLIISRYTYMISSEKSKLEITINFIKILKSSKFQNLHKKNLEIWELGRKFPSVYCS
jgi:hypothetical protein